MSENYAESLWARAVAHGISAKVLAEIAREEGLAKGAKDMDRAVFNGRYSPSIYLLASFSFELFLKSAFIALGGDSARLKREAGHDLSAAMTLAAEVGFVPQHELASAVAETLTATHLPNHFRYGDAGRVQVPALNQVFEVLDGHYSQIRPLIYPVPSDI